MKGSIFNNYINNINNECIMYITYILYYKPIHTVCSWIFTYNLWKLIHTVNE